MEQAHETFYLTSSVQHESQSPRIINNFCTAKCDPSSNHIDANRTNHPNNYRKNVHLWILAFLIVLVVIILGIRIITITSNSLVNVDSCQTIECINVMRQIKSSIHEHIDPCDDFYQFACQGWILDYANKLEEQGENSTDTIDEIGETNKLLLNDLIDGIDHHNSTGNSVEIKAKLFYLSCLNKNGTLSDNLESLQYLLMGINNTTTDSSESLLVDTEYENELDEHYTTQNSDDVRDAGEDDEDEWGLEDFLSIDEDSTSLACMECTLKLFPQTVGRLFVQQYYLHQEPSVNKLLSILQSKFESTIKQMHWIDEESKRNITENIFSNLTMLVGYSNKTMNSTMIWLEDYIYENVTVSEHGDKFLSNMQSLLEVIKFHTDDFEDDSNETSDPSNHADEMLEQLMATTTTMEMQYRPDLNAVIIPVGIVQKPLFHPGYPNLINFARLGMMVGHEFGHALIRYMDGFTDETGVKYPSQIVTNRATLDGYEERCQCVKEQYDGFQVPLPSQFNNITIMVNGTFTLEENVADLIGIQIAFKAFQSDDSDDSNLLPGYTNEQLFFIASAQNWCQSFAHDNAAVSHLKDLVETDEHSPAPTRVLGKLSNFKEFASAFNCPMGSRYNPKSKCDFH